jgi:hypothetical protein
MVTFIKIEDIMFITIGISRKGGIKEMTDSMMRKIFVLMLVLVFVGTSGVFAQPDNISSHINQLTDTSIAQEPGSQPPSRMSRGCYWLTTYEGNDYPENEGWIWSFNEPFAERWFEGGSFVVDTTGDLRTCDWYEYYTDVPYPEQGQQLIIQWRLKVEEFCGVFSAGGIGIRTWDSWGVGFILRDHTIQSSLEPSVIASFEAGIFHEFEMRSPDMRAYALYIDGELALEGSFIEVTSSNRIFWGESTTAGGSLCRWGYVRVGILPLLLGDLNVDGSVGLEDLSILLSNYGMTSGATYEQGDLDFDGDIDLTDLAELLGHYGEAL